MFHAGILLKVRYFLGMQLRLSHVDSLGDRLPLSPSMIKRRRSLKWPWHFALYSMGPGPKKSKNEGACVKFPFTRLYASSCWADHLRTAIGHWWKTPIGSTMSSTSCGTCSQTPIPFLPNLVHAVMRIWKTLLYARCGHDLDLLPSCCGTSSVKRLCTLRGRRSPIAPVPISWNIRMSWISSSKGLDRWQERRHSPANNP